MIAINESTVLKCLQLLTMYPSSVAWGDLGEAGSPYYDPHNLTKEEFLKENLTLLIIKDVMPKYSSLHLNLSCKIKNLLGQTRISYPWLINVCARIISGFESYSSFFAMIYLTDTMQKRNKNCTCC